MQTTNTKTNMTMKDALQIHIGDCRQVLAGMTGESVNCCVTSPPYWGLRDYGHSGQLGAEATHQDYVANMVDVFREVRRVLKPDGVLWLNLGDTYATGAQPGLKPKDMAGIPWRVALALQADGWWLRSDVIWQKTNPMPESVTDRPTRCHEYLFLLTKAESYYYNAAAIAEPVTNTNPTGRGSTLRVDKVPRDRKPNGNGSVDALKDATTRNKRSVWTLATAAYKDAHFATFPPDLVRPCILSGCPTGGTVLDPFAGSGTTGMVALEEGRRAILIELNPEYAALCGKRTNVTPAFAF